MMAKCSIQKKDIQMLNVYVCDHYVIYRDLENQWFETVHNGAF